MCRNLGSKLIVELLDVGTTPRALRLMKRINAECANVGEFDCRHYGAYVNGRFLGN